MKKNRNIIFTTLVSILAFFPVLSFAAVDPIVKYCGATIDSIGNIICRLGFYMNAIVPVIIALGVLYFVWGVVEYVIKDDEEAKKRGKNRIIYGIIGLVVIVSMWGLVSIVINSFGLKNTIEFENPADIVNTTTQSTNSALCFANYSGISKPKLGDVINYITCLISTSVIPLIFTLAIAMFVWGVVQYVINDQEEAKRTKGKQFMLWGIIALAVMVSIWGLVAIFTNSFKIDFNVPQVKEQS